MDSSKRKRENVFSRSVTFVSCKVALLKSQLCLLLLFFYSSTNCHFVNEMTANINNIWEGMIGSLLGKIKNSKSTYKSVKTIPFQLSTAENWRKTSLRILFYFFDFSKTNVCIVFHF